MVLQAMTPRARSVKLTLSSPGAEEIDLCSKPNAGTTPRVTTQVQNLPSNPMNDRAAGLVSCGGDLNASCRSLDLLASLSTSLCYSIWVSGFE